MVGSGLAVNSSDASRTGEADLPTADRINALARTVAELLLERGQVMAVAESCTAGAVTSALASGGSAETWLRASLVAYQETVKRELLGVRSRSLVVPAAATEMAHGVTRLFDTPVALATTGVFGSEPVDGVDPTVVIVATLVRGDCVVTRHELDDDPETASDQATEVALTGLVDHLRARG